MLQQIGLPFPGVKRTVYIILEADNALEQHRMSGLSNPIATWTLGLAQFQFPVRPGAKHSREPVSVPYSNECRAKLRLEHSSISIGAVAIVYIALGCKHVS